MNECFIRLVVFLIKHLVSCIKLSEGSANPRFIFLRLRRGELEKVARFGGYVGATTVASGQKFENYKTFLD